MDSLQEGVGEVSAASVHRGLRVSRPAEEAFEASWNNGTMI